TSAQPARVPKKPRLPQGQPDEPQFVRRTSIAAVFPGLGRGRRAGAPLRGSAQPVVVVVVVVPVVVVPESSLPCTFRSRSWSVPVAVVAAPVPAAWQRRACSFTLPP